MTGCATCGAAVGMDKSEGGTTKGPFREEYSCVNGHTGIIKGDASDPPTEWRRIGAVFND